MVKHVITVFQQPDSLMINHMHEVSSKHQELQSILCIVEACRCCDLKAYTHTAPFKFTASGIISLNSV